MAQARIAALQARADEALTLVARGSGGAFEEDFRSDGSHWPATTARAACSRQARAPGHRPSGPQALADRRGRRDQVAAPSTPTARPRRRRPVPGRGAGRHRRPTPASAASLFNRVDADLAGGDRDRQPRLRPAGAPRGRRPDRHRLGSRGSLTVDPPGRAGGRPPAADRGVPMNGVSMSARAAGGDGRRAALALAVAGCSTTPAARTGADPVARSRPGRRGAGPGRDPEHQRRSGDTSCDPLASLRPGALPAPGAMPAGSTMAAIAAARPAGGRRRPEHLPVRLPRRRHRTTSSGSTSTSPARSPGPSSATRTRSSSSPSPPRSASRTCRTARSTWSPTP